MASETPGEIERLRQEVASLQTERTRLVGALQQAEDEQRRLQQALDSQENRFRDAGEELLQSYLRALDQIHAMQSTLGWKVLEEYRRVSLRLMPEGTRRRRLFWRAVYALVGVINKLRGEQRPYRYPVPQTASGFRPAPPVTVRDVTVVIPVYNATDAVKACIESVARHTDLRRARLVLIDDASTDSTTTELLRATAESLLAEGARVDLLQHERNLGFVASANQGMTLDRSDVVLLNSDTIVSAAWLEGLQGAAYSRPNVATVTPFTNNGTICSIPTFLKSNEVPAGFSIESFAELIATVGLRHYPELPTAVGFCMYIRRSALDAVGLFDEELFGRGYGEENDFCIRASRLGFCHVLDDATYVFHTGRQSFQEEASALVEKHVAVVERVHPGYLALVGEFIRSNPLRYEHEYLASWIERG